MENISFVFDNDGIPNSVYEENGKRYRVRVETLILNKNDEVLINYTNKLNQYGRYYKIPGGSIEPGLTLEQCAQKECNEEVRIVIDDIKYCCKIKTLYKKIPEWHKTILWPIGLKYNGSVTFVFLARYKKKYKGFIGERESEPDMLNNAKFYNIKTVMPLLCKEHQRILLNVL